MNFLDLFWNREQRRVRALWRIVALMMVLLPVLSLIKKYLGEGLLYNTTEFVLILILIWLVGHLLDRRYFADFGFRFDKNWWMDFGFGLLVGVFIPTFIFLVGLVTNWVIVTGTFVTPNPDDRFVLSILYPLVMFIFVGINEELIFRGYMLTNLAEGFNWKPNSSRWAVAIAVLLSSLIFGLLHWVLNENGTAVGALSAFVGGIFVAFGYVLTGELAIPIGIHITWNLFEGNVFGFVVSGIDYSATTFIATERVGPTLWVGGIYGPEEGLLSISATIVGCLLIMLWVRLHYGHTKLCSAIAEAPQ